jgi:hypothetical protein
MLYDAFICHASEDKEVFVRPLADALANIHLSIWYDEFSLSVGDSLRQTIDEGLAKSRFGIVVLSPSFFRKGWAQRELDGLVARQIAENRRIVLPIWHDITQAEILKVSPPLADVVAVNSSRGIEYVCNELAKKIRPEESPLIAARDELIRYGHEPPVISDEWWIDIIEMKETDFSWPYVSSRRWIFPLPHSGYVIGKKRGINIAWTAMQLEWSDAAENSEHCKISQMTPPEVVHDFITSFPALSEACHQHPDHLAGYVPQLLLPQFSGPFSPLFDDLLKKSITTHREEAARESISGTALTIDGNVPLCDSEWALRHPTFGNYRPETVANKWLDGMGSSFSARCYEQIDYLVWLLSDESIWLPKEIRDVLLRGMRDWSQWARPELAFGEKKNAFMAKLFKAHEKKRKTFQYDASARAALQELIENSLAALRIKGSAEVIVGKFIDGKFADRFLTFQDRIKEERNHRSAQRRSRSIK